MIAAVFLAASLTGVAQAQEALEPPPAPEGAWGTSWSSTTTLGAYRFVGRLADTVDGRRVCGAGAAGTTCRADVDLQSGIFIHNVEIEGCDNSPTTEGVARLWVCLGTCTVYHETRTGIAAADGCTRFRGTVSPYLTVYNYGYSYFLEVFGTDGASNVPFEFRAIRLNTARQVSPPPQTATFGDVPTTHPFYRFIEALADSRISGGCGPGLFCPERPVTRGEMAVLLSTALGLNFPD